MANQIEQHPAFVPFRPPLESTDAPTHSPKRPRMERSVRAVSSSSATLKVSPLNIHLPSGWHSATGCGCLDAVFEYITDPIRCSDAIKDAAIRLMMAFGQALQGPGSPAKRCFKTFIECKGVDGLQYVYALLSRVLFGNSIGAVSKLLFSYRLAY